MSTSGTPRLTRLIQGYYWLTPVFLFISWRFGIDVRVPFLEAIPGARGTYYAAVIACGVLVAYQPGLTALVARVESALSMGTLIVTTWFAYFAMIDSAASETAAFNNPFTPEAVMSLAMSALVLLASAALQMTSGGDDPGCERGTSPKTGPALPGRHRTP